MIKLTNKSSPTEKNYSKITVSTKITSINLYISARTRFNISTAIVLNISLTKFEII
jgi:hypothetical protein